MDTDRFELLTQGPLKTGTYRSLRFAFHPAGARPAGSRLWVFFDIRQDPGVPQHTDPTGPNHVSAVAASGRPVTCEAFFARTLDLYPRLPEFLHVCEMCFEQGLPHDDTVTIRLGNQAAGWQVPKHPIEPFRFWFVESEPGGWRFRPTGYKTYRRFSSLGQTDDSPSVSGELSTAIVGDLPRPAAENTRPTPGILWGDIHGMAFNQRPLDDYYRYARDVAHLDFAAAMLFSYNICIDGVWQEVVDAAARWTEPGRFLAIVGVESGTVPDGSHRNAYYLDPNGVPPILCEDRPPAHDPRLVRRYRDNTVYCEDLDTFYETVSRYGGLVTGHFHTQRYDREILAEIWQKQSACLGEEKRIYQLLNDGFRLGIVSGSDTHDSMPGNPKPEPMLPQPAGLMAVLADDASGQSIRKAMVRRQVYGTTGARIVLHFTADGRQMGSVLPVDTPRQFDIRIQGLAPLSSVELVRDGRVIRRTEPSGRSLQTQFVDQDRADQRTHWYLLKVTQADGHRAWSSPIWFEGSGDSG